MTILVTAGSGKVGREIVAQLHGRGVHVRAGSRRSEIPLDWNDQATWPAALEGVEAVMVIVPGGDDGYRSVAGFGAAVQQFLDVAQHRAGVRRVVLMTALGMEHAPAQVEQRAVELHLQHTGPGWTILRPNWFFQNLTDGPLRAIADAHDGVLRLPAEDAAVSFIDARDIAAIAADALLGGHEGREYALTGPQSLTFFDVAATCRDSLVPVNAYEPISENDFHRMALSMGWHRDYVDTITSLCATIAAGHAAPVLPDTATLLGCAPRTLPDYITQAR